MGSIGLVAGTLLAAVMGAAPALAADQPAAAEGKAEAAGPASPSAGTETAPGVSKADETYNAGRDLLNKGLYADACPKFEASQRAAPAAVTLLALAYCEELSGLLATAWTNYLNAAELAGRAGEAERRALASERAKKLAVRLSTLTLTVPEELVRLPGLKVLRDGMEIERASFNARVPMNGGAHSVEVRAPGRAGWSGLVTLQAEYDHKTLALPVLELEPSESSSAHGGPLLAAAPPEDSRDERRSRRDLQRIGLGLGIGAAAAVVIGTAFGIAAKVRLDQSNEQGHCDNGCDDYGFDKRESAGRAADVSTVAFIAGGVLAAGSVTFFLVARGEDDSASHGARQSLRATVAGGAPQLIYGHAF